MTAKESIKVLEEMNKWRRSRPPYDKKGTPLPFPPHVLGEAIDKAASQLEKSEVLFAVTRDFFNAYHININRKAFEQHLLNIKKALEDYEK